MFDKLFEFIKKLVAPISKKKEGGDNVVPKGESAAENKEIPQPQPNESSTQNEPVIPTAIQEEKSQDSSALAQTKISLDEQRKLLEDRRKVPGWILLLKYLSIVLLLVSGLGFVWLTADLDPTNRYLSLFNLQENVGLKFESLNRRQKLLEEENRTFESKIRQITNQLESEKYSIFTDTIQKIRADQLLWFDQKDEEGNIHYGILDAVDRMGQYFNSKNFDHSILSGSGNQMEIEDIWGSREYVSFSASGANLFGKVFFLNTEFIKMMNSFSLFKGGEIRSFSKKKDKDGNDTMSFSVKLDIQGNDEKDPDDEYFSIYEKWISTYAPNK